MSESTTLLKPPTKLDYSLTGESAARAVERGLAEADWYQSPVPRGYEKQRISPPRLAPAWYFA